MLDHSDQRLLTYSPTGLAAESLAPNIVNWDHILKIFIFSIFELNFLIRYSFLFSINQIKYRNEFLFTVGLLLCGTLVFLCLVLFFGMLDPLFCDRNYGSHEFALTYNQIEIVSIFGMQSKGRAPSSEYSPNPENSPYPQAEIRIVST